MKSRDLLLVFAGMLLAQTILFGLFYWDHDRALVDDAFISFRYAERFGDGLGLTYNDGEAVEGFSNPLWTLLLGVFSAMGMAPHQVAPVLAFALLLGSLLVLYRFGRRVPWGIPAKALLLGVLAVDGGVLLWSGSGLETPLVVFLVCLWLTQAWPMGMDRSQGRALRLGVLTGLLLLSRPEAVLWLLPMGAWLLWGLWLPLRSLLTIVVSAVVLPGAYLVFRWVTYGALLPNTFFAKVEPGSQGLMQGLENLGWWGLSHAALAFLVLLTLTRHPFGKSAQGPPWLRAFLVGWLFMQAAFVFAVGGDWMGHTRYLAVVIPVLAFLVAWQWEQRFSVLREGRGLLVVLVFLFVHAGVGWASRDIIPRYTPVGESLGLWLKQQSKPNDLIAVTAAGAIPYFSKLPTYDVLGLNDPEVRGRAAKRTGSWAPGHNRYDLDALMASRPKWIVWDFGVELNRRRLSTLRNYPGDVDELDFRRGLLARKDFRALYEIDTRSPASTQRAYTVFRRRDP